MVPLAEAHGAALIALTIDEVGMAKTAERKLEVAQRITHLCCDEHELEREALIFDCLTFTLTTGDPEWRRSAVETIEGIRLVKQELPGVKTSLGVSNVSFGVGMAARAVLNSVFLHHCVEAGLDLAMVNPNHITPYAEIPEAERELADDLVFDRRDDALERFIAHFEAKAPQDGDGAAAAANPTEGMEPEEALHFHILRRKKEGVEDWIDASVEKIGAVPTLNEVLLPAMKEVGDKFGAGELILPFVLQSAEVMKRAVARLERYLDKLEGYTKGTVVIATVFGDVHDIGKSLVNTILTNNGYTVIDLGKQVPISNILDAAVDHQATAIGLSALLVSTSKQMPACVQELHERKLPFPVLIGGAAINRNFGLRILYPNAADSDEVYEPGVFYCKDAFEGLAKMDQLVDSDTRKALVASTRAAAQRLREQPADEPDDAPPVTDSSVRSSTRTDNPIPQPPFWGVRELEVPLDEVYRHLDTHVLFKLHWGGRGVKGDDWARLLRDDFQPRLERMWSEQTYLEPRALLGYFPCNSDGNELIVWDPNNPGARELDRLVFPRQPRHDRICLADFYRPLGAEPDVVALQAVTAGGQVTELMASLEAEGEFAEQLFVHGLGVQTAEGMAEWLHARVRCELGIEPAQGRRYSWGYPSCPEQSELTKVFPLLDAPSIGLRLSGGYAIEPEQSTLAIVAHHPQAVYFGMRSGTLPRTAKQADDELIAGTDKDPTRMRDAQRRRAGTGARRRRRRWPGLTHPEASLRSAAPRREQRVVGIEVSVGDRLPAHRRSNPRSAAPSDLGQRDRIVEQTVGGLGQRLGRCVARDQPGVNRAQQLGRGPHRRSQNRRTTRQRLGSRQAEALEPRARNHHQGRAPIPTGQLAVGYPPKPSHALVEVELRSDTAKLGLHLPDPGDGQGRARMGGHNLGKRSQQAVHARPGRQPPGREQQRCLDSGPLHATVG